MRIMHTDNFGGDYPGECFVEGLPVLSRDKLQQIANTINAGNEFAPRFYSVVEDDYKLRPGFEP